jgi:hypothetical protein
MRTPYEIVNAGRKPDIDRLFIRVFGCPVQFKPLDKPLTKMTERTLDGYFLGVDFPSVIVQRASDGKLMRISPKKVRCHESAYCHERYVGVEHLKHLVSFDEGDQEIPVSVPSLKVLRPGTLFDPLVNQGESNVQPVEYREEHSEIDEESNVDLVKRLKQYLLRKSVGPEVHDALAKVAQGVEKLEGASGHVPGAGDRKSVASGQVPGAGERESVVSGQVPGADDFAGVESGQEKRGVSVGARTRANTRKAPVGDSLLPQATSVHAPLNVSVPEHVSERVDDSDEESLRPPIRDVPIGSRVMIESVRFDGNVPGSYSGTVAKYTHGTVVSRQKGGVVEVQWDGDDSNVRSHWSHLLYSDEHGTWPCGVIGPPRTKVRRLEQSSEPGEAYMCMARRLGLPEWQEPFRTLAAVERATVGECESKALEGEVGRTPPVPSSVWEALLMPNWREWMVAVKKEHDGWREANAYRVTTIDKMIPNSSCVDILEIFTVKRSGVCKFRSCLMGNQLRKDIDYKNTFSATVTADNIRFFFSLATQLGHQVHGADVRCAYLQGKQRIPIYAFMPVYFGLSDMSWEALAELRKKLEKVVATGGVKKIRELARTKRRSSNQVIELLASVYGTPDAGNAWGLLLIDILTKRMGFKRSQVDGCLYFKTNKRYHQAQNDVDSVWVTEYIVVLTWTDDMPYFGTKEMVEWYRAELPKHCPIEWTEVCVDFIGIEIHQDLELGVTALTQAKYWVLVKERFKEYLSLSGSRVRIPLPEGTVSVPATREEHELAMSMPYQELVGCLAFPSCHTKLGIRYAISILSSHMQCWSLEHWKLAIHCLWYCYNSRHIGLMFSRGLDQHGINVLYAYADSAFTAPRSQGCRMVLMNGCLVSLSSQKHPTIDVSTTAAEITEAFYCSNDAVGFRNLMEEMGFVLQGPTVIYEDNQPAIKVLEGNRNLTSKTKHMDIRVWKMRERLDDQQVVLRFCSTTDMLADIGTKALGVRAFEYLRDLMNGYALVRLRHKEYVMPAMVIAWSDLVSSMPSECTR